MKKIILLIFTSLISFIVIAQDEWWIGGRLGVNFTTTVGTNNIEEEATINTSFIVTPLVGMVGMYTFSPLFTLSTELNMAKTGSSSTIQFDNDSGWKGRVRYTTINIPIHARFTFGEDWSFFVYGGLYWSMILCGKSEVDYGDGKESRKIKYGDVYARRMDLGINIGAGVQKHMATGTLGIDLRFGQGFIAIYDYKYSNSTATRNRSINLTVLYNYNFRKN